MNIRGLGLLILAMALIMGGIAAPAAAAVPDEVTKGEFVTLPGGTALGYTVTGRAVMRRMADGGGTTTVKVQVKGLDAKTVYPTHVHNASCSSTPPGGSHYQHVIGGPVDAVNEMWPVVTTSPAGRGHGAATHGNWARPDAMSIVIHYPADTSIRLACVDLVGHAGSAEGPEEVARGVFVTLSGGAALGYTVTGRAVMRRMADGGGTTTVRVQVKGLDAKTVYPTHVHNGPCSSTPPGGSHYQHVIGGPVDAVNEMWPVVTTSPAGRGQGFATHGNWARPDAMSIVIHYPADTSIRLACADLS